MSDNDFVVCTPTWQGVLPMLIEVAINGDTTEGRKAARDELMRCAKIADDHIANCGK